MLLHRIFVELRFSKPSKNSVSLTILLSCNFKGLVFNFFLNQNRNKYWLPAYSCDLFTSRKLVSKVMLRDRSHDFAGYVINIVGLEDVGCH